MQAGGQGFDPPNLHKPNLNGTSMWDFASVRLQNVIAKNQNALVIGFCFIIFSLRGINSLLDQFLYAEDGVWLSSVIREGFFSASFNSRPDYPILIQGILLEIVSETGRGIFHDPVIHSPQLIFLISTLFLTGVFFFIFLALKKWLSAIHAFLGVALTALVPVGITSNEIFGRILQLGFFLPVFCWAILALRLESRSKAKNYVYDLLVGMSFFTNPITLVTAWAQIFLSKPSALQSTRKFIRDWQLLLLISVLFVAQQLLFRAPGQGGIPGGLNSAGILGYFTRSSLFSIVGLPYTQANLGIWFMLSLVFLAFCWFGWRKMAPTNRNSSTTLFALWFLVTIIGLIARPGLTNFTITSQSSFPDRYFLASNIFFILFSLSVLIGQHEKVPHQKSGRKKSLWVLLVIALLASQAFEFNGPRMIIVTDENYSWKKSVCSVEKNTEDNSRTLKLWPDGWTANFPVSEFAQKSCE